MREFFVLLLKRERERINKYVKMVTIVRIQMKNTREFFVLLKVLFEIISK